MKRSTRAYRAAARNAETAAAQRLAADTNTGPARENLLRSAERYERTAAEWRRIGREEASMEARCWCGRRVPESSLDGINCREHDAEPVESGPSAPLTPGGVR